MKLIKIIKSVFYKKFRNTTICPKCGGEMKLEDIDDSFTISYNCSECKSWMYHPL